MSIRRKWTSHMEHENRRTRRNTPPGAVKNDTESPLISEADDDHTAFVKFQQHVQDVIAEKINRLNHFKDKVAEFEIGDDMDTACANAMFEELELKTDTNSSWFLSAWFTLFRLRQAFFLTCAFAILLALFSGLLMEIFFSTMGGAHLHFTNWRLWIKWHWIFFLLPFLMMVLALLGDEMCDLILDSLDFPALHGFQASLITAMRWRPEKDRPKPDVKRELKYVRIADWVTFTVFEIIPVVVGVLFVLFLSKTLGQGPSTTFVEGYVQGSLLSAILCTILFVISDMRVSAKGWEDDQEYYAGRIDAAKMRPYGIHAALKASYYEIDHVGDEESPQVGDCRFGSKTRSFGARLRHRCRSLCTCSWWCGGAILMVLLWTMVVGSFVNFNKTADWWDPVIMGLALVATVSICSVALHKACPGVYSAPYVLILAFFVLVGVALNCSSVASPEAKGSNMKAIMSVVPEASVASELPERWPGNSPGALQVPQPYPICTQTWGSKDSPLTALDLANLAWMVYDNSADQDKDVNMRVMLRQSFPADRRAELVHVEPYNTLPRWAHFYFPSTGNASRGTRVVAVKGTSTVTDALMDTNLFSTVKVLQAMDKVLPVITVLPRLVIQFLLEKVHLGTSRQAEELVWGSLETSVSKLQKDYPNDDIVITGHSLGGGLSQIVAAKRFVPALVWSAPGAAFSAKRFGIEVQSLKRNVVSVMPDHDVVPRVDLQVGTLQLIECRNKDGSEAISLFCHSLVKTACEVWRACGDPRDFRRSCDSYVDKDDLGHLYYRDDSTA